jgi:adenosine deaminase
MTGHNAGMAGNGWSMLGSPEVLREMPKAELHVHLGGTIREETASDLARGHGLDPTEVLRLVDGRYPGTYKEFPDFLDTFLASNSLVRTPDDLYLVAQRFARQQAEEQIVWSEVIFTAMIYVRNGMEPKAMWEALDVGLKEGGENIRIGIVVDAIRDLGRGEAEATIQLVESAEAPIVGLCLTGIEGTVPTSEFVVLTEACNALGLGLEVHAGEMGPPSSVIEALDVLHRSLLVCRCELQCVV